MGIFSGLQRVLLIKWWRGKKTAKIYNYETAWNEVEYILVKSQCVKKFTISKEIELGYFYFSLSYSPPFWN